MPSYPLILEDEQGQPDTATPEIIASMNENLIQRGIEGRITNGPGGLKFLYDNPLDALVNQGKLRVVMEGEPGYKGNTMTYILEEIGEDNNGQIYNAMFSVSRGGRRRGKKTRKPKRKAKLTRRR